MVEEWLNEDMAIREGLEGDRKAAPETVGGQPQADRVPQVWRWTGSRPQSPRRLLSQGSLSGPLMGIKGAQVSVGAADRLRPRGVPPPLGRD